MKIENRKWQIVTRQLSLIACLYLLLAPSSWHLTPCFGQQPVNGLEKGEGQRRAVALTLAQSRATSDQKRVAREQAKVAAAPAAQVAAVAKAQTAMTAAKTPAEKAAAASQLASAQKITANAQAKLDAANKRLTADQKMATNEQVRVADWNTKTLATHKAAGKSIDWKKGTIN